MSLRFLGLMICLLFLLTPSDANAQRRKKSIIPDAPGASDKDQSKETENKKTSVDAPSEDIFNRPPAGAKKAMRSRPPQPKKALGASDKTPNKSNDLPSPQTVVINSKLAGTDGIDLSCMMFVSPLSAPAAAGQANAANTTPKALNAPTQTAKDVAPIILVHDWGGTMTDMAPLAQHLQSAGHTVLVPDLRGHGRSTTIKNSTVVIDYSEFRKTDILTIINDLEACKKYLMTHNNDGKLNINMLSVVVVGDMCPLATQWVLQDWSYQNFGSIRQGKDVQSLVLVSPKRKFKNYSMSKLVKDTPLLSGKNSYHIPTLVIWGSASQSAKDTSAVYRVMAKHRPPSAATAPAERWAQQDLYKLELPVSDEGIDLLKPNEALYRFMTLFYQQKVMANAKHLAWQSRVRKKSK